MVGVAGIDEHAENHHQLVHCFSFTACDFNVTTLSVIFSCRTHRFHRNSSLVFVKDLFQSWVIWQHLSPVATESAV